MKRHASMRRLGKAGLCRWALAGMALTLSACGEPGHERATTGVQGIVERAGELPLGGEQSIRVPEEVLDLYRDRGYQPLWVNDEGLNGPGAELLELLRSAHEEGLPADRYHAERLDGMDDPSQLEVALTSMVLRYATDLVRGYRDPADAEVDWLIPRAEAPGRAFLGRLEEGEPPAQLLEELRPGSPQYARLVTSLRHYRQVEEAGGWPTLPDDVTLEEGDVGEEVLLLRRRLVAEGDSVERILAEPESDAPPERFDARLREAVEHLQARFALEADG
jgi:L,D-transpeptidase YcbB